MKNKEITMPITVILGESKVVFVPLTHNNIENSIGLFKKNTGKFSDVYLEDLPKAVEESIPRMEEIANRVLLENGVEYKAKAEWGTEAYPTRVYENVTLPAGEYRSLRLKLGKGEGKNWWCVLFPPLCTRASADLSGTDVNKKDTEVFSNKKYIFRFKFLELFWR